MSWEVKFVCYENETVNLNHVFKLFIFHQKNRNIICLDWLHQKLHPWKVVLLKMDYILVELFAWGIAGRKLTCFLITVCINTSDEAENLSTVKMHDTMKRINFFTVLIWTNLLQTHSQFPIVFAFAETSNFFLINVIKPSHVISRITFSFKRIMKP